MSLEEHIKQYIRLLIKQSKFEVIEFFAKERAKILIGLTLIPLLLITIFFGSLYTSLLLNEIMESNYSGFGMVFLFWSLLLILFFLFKSTIKEKLFKKYANENIPL